jgi:hypothetical protein
MSSEDTPRRGQGGVPTDSQGKPTDHHHSNPDVKMDEGSKDYHPDPDEYYPERPQEQPGWRGRLAKIRNFIVRPAEFWIALFTVVLAVETGISLRILSKTDEALHKTSESTDKIRELTEANNRAWLAPLPAIINQIPTVGNLAKVALTYTNVGHSPATNILLSYLFDSVSSPPDNDMNRGDPVNEDFCKEYPPKDDAGTAYPNAGSSTYSTMSFPIRWDSDFVQENKLLRVRFCLAYKTFEKIHYTWKCYYFIPQWRLLPNGKFPPKEAENIIGIVAVNCIGGSGAN